MSQEIKENYEKVLKELDSLKTERFGVHRPKLLVVSKSKPSSDIEFLYSLGQKAFAENYAQEFVQKKEELKALEIEWHFIGSLQRNKLRKIVGEVDLIHSVDSQRLLSEIQRIAAEKKCVQKVLLQIYWQKDSERGGILPEEISTILQESSSFKNIKICGFMTVPPVSDEPQSAQKYFAELRSLRDLYRLQWADLIELSMGMSSDYIYAIEEGASILRLGSSILGQR